MPIFFGKNIIYRVMGSLAMTSVLVEIVGFPKS